jgi:hypothetical protein
MEDYLISEVIEFNCDEEGVINVVFKLEEDSEEKVRVLESDDYYYYAEEICVEDGSYMTKEWEEGDFESEGHHYPQFDFREWLEFEHDEGSVKNFIYEYFKKEDLPELIDG